MMRPPVRSSNRSIDNRNVEGFLFNDHHHLAVASMNLRWTFELVVTVVICSSMLGVMAMLTGTKPTWPESVQCSGERTAKNGQVSVSFIKAGTSVGVGGRSSAV